MGATQNSKLLKFLSTSLILILGTSLLTCLLSWRSWYKPSIEMGSISPMTIKVERDIKVRDQIKINEAREEARLTAIQNLGRREILKVDSEVTNSNLRNLAFLIEVSRNVLRKRAITFPTINPKISPEEQAKLINLSEETFTELLIKLQDSHKITSNEDIATLKSLSEIELKLFLDEIKTYREKVSKVNNAKQDLGNRFFENLKKTYHENIFAKAYPVQRKLMELGIVHGMPRKKIHENIQILFPELYGLELELVQKLIEVSTLPNIKIDWHKVKEIEANAMDSVPDLSNKLQAGQILATKGKIIGPQNYYYLKELKQLSPPTDWEQIYKNLGVLSAAVFLIAFTAWLSNRKRFSLREISMIFMVTFFTAATLDVISVWGVEFLTLSPLAALSILLTCFYAPILAAFLATLFTFFMLTSFDMNVWQVLPIWIGALYAIVLTRKAHQREDLTKAGTRIALLQASIYAVTFPYAVAGADFEIIAAATHAVFYAFSGLAAGFISLATLPYLESSFKIITPFKLAELSNPNQPLLVKLKEAAPGTYQHSLNVSHLAEEAGAAVGANTELIRVGLLYHDIGKTYKPDYFIENMLGKPNPHNTLDDPKKSAQIIIAHVPEGIELAKKYNLPKSIVDFIPMHQGTTITNYFYHKAVEARGKKNINPNEFRYPGPKPNSKETGIAMIADSTEAALKSMKDLDNEAKAKEMIDKIIKARLAEGELDNSGLNKEDLTKISKAFVRVWRTINHERIKYPEPQEDNV